MRTTRLLALAATSALALAACAPVSSDSPSSGSSSSAADGGYVTAGKLTVATSEPAYEPWVVDDDPTSGKGFESAVAYAVAKQLGFPAGKVKWTVATFDSVIAPTQKNYDFDINEFDITAKRAKVVDFSSGYYDVTQALVTVKGSKIAGAKAIADLKGAKLGAQRGTTSYQAILDQIKPTNAPAVYPSNDNAKLALSNGQIDGLVVDLPTAFYIAFGELTNGVLVGQLANSASGTEQLGFVLQKNSPLTQCVTQAVDALKADGSLQKLQDQWLSASAGAPVLK